MLADQGRGRGRVRAIAANAAAFAAIRSGTLQVGEIGAGSSRGGPARGRDSYCGAGLDRCGGSRATR